MVHDDFFPVIIRVNLKKQNLKGQELFGQMKVHDNIKIWT